MCCHALATSSIFCAAVAALGDAAEDTCLCLQDVSKIASSVGHMLQVMRQPMPLVAPGVAASAAARAAAGSSCATSRVTACAEQTVVAHGTGRSSLC